MSRRTERIASLIRQIVGNAIHHELSDPRIEPLTSVTKVDVSDDLSTARVHVSVMARPSRQELCLRALESASGKLRTLLAQQLTLRQAPRLQFELDESLRRGFETVQQIDALMQEMAARTNAAGSDSSPAEEGAPEAPDAAAENVAEPTAGLVDPRDLIDHTAPEMPFPAPAAPAPDKKSEEH